MIEPLDEDWFVLLNTDCFVTKGWLGKMMKAARMPSVGFVGPMTDNCGSAQKITQGYRAEDYTGKVAISSRNTRRKPLWWDLSGFCLMVRKIAWEACGGFDETSPFYGQESLLIKKGWRDGWKTVMVLDCFVTHLGGATARERFGDDLDDEKQKGGQWFQSKLKELR